MSKLIFILFLFFCSLQAFCQKVVPNEKTEKAVISNKLGELEKVTTETADVKKVADKNIFMLLEDNLCEILAIKPSDLLSESMLKKLKANV